MARDICQTCNLCCKLLGVLEIEKPAHTWCSHCAPGREGCTIYETRPGSCQTYECFYYTMKDRGETIPTSLRPDRCHVIIDASLDGLEHSVRVDPGYGEDALKRDQGVLKLVMALVEHGPVWLVAGESRRRIRQVGEGKISIDKRTTD